MPADVGSSAYPELSSARTSNGGDASVVDAASRNSFRRNIWIVVGIALALRLVALAFASDAQLVKDEIAYVSRAEALLDGRGYLGSYQSWVRHPGWRIMDLPQYPGAYQPPGYPTFIAAIFALSARSLVAVKLVQCVLSALSCLLLLRLGRAWFSERAGLVAAWLWALYPNAIAFPHLLWSETLFIFLFLALLDCLLGANASQPSASSSSGRTWALPSRRRCALGGVLLAMAALTRGTVVYLAPILVLWMVLLGEGAQGVPRWRSLAWRDGVVRGAIVLGVALACIAPWTARNYALHGGFVLIDTNAPYNLWRGNAPGAMDVRKIPGEPRYSWPFESIPMRPVANLSGRQLVDDYRRDHSQREVGGALAMPGDLEVAAYASAVSWEAILDDPARTLRHAVLKLVDMWNPTSFLIRHLELGAYGPAPLGAKSAISAAAAASYLGVVALGVFGLARGLRDRRIWFVILLLVYFSAISALAFGLTRFRLPLMPFLVLVAGVELARLHPGARWRSRGVQD